jgi:hypothetical protein
MQNEIVNNAQQMAQADEHHQMDLQHAQETNANELDMQHEQNEAAAEKKSEGE